MAIVHPARPPTSAGTTGWSRPLCWPGGPATRAGVEHLAHVARQEVSGEGFLKVGDSGVEHAVVSDHAIRVSRHIEHADPGLDIGDPLGELTSAHLGHDNVREQEMDGLTVPANEVEGVSAVTRLENRVAVHPQHFTGQQPHRAIVFDEEHRY